MAKCIVCSTEMESSKRLKGLLECPCCGFVMADIHLDNDALEELYSENYFMGEEYTDYLSDEKLHKHNFNRRIARIKNKIGCIENMNVLEIGCAYGLFLDVIKNHVGKVYGIDISRDAITYAKKRIGSKASVSQGDYLAKEIQHNGKYNLVCMWDVIEHLAEPQAYLKKINLELQQGGYICVTTGDIGSINAKIRGKKWRQIHPPTHLCYFSQKTLALLLKKYGFEVVDISYPGNEMSFRNIFYSVLCLRLKRLVLYDCIRHLPFMNASIYINLHDYMFVIAKKEREI